MRRRLVAIFGGALFFLAFAAALVRRPVAALLALGLALLLRLAWTAGRPRPSFAVSGLGVAWTHPLRGPGALTWKQVGALVVREARGGRELAVYLVPAPPERPGAEAPASFVLSTDDLGRGRSEGEERLREFVAAVWPRLPAGVAVDRETRARLVGWGVAADTPPRGNG